MSEEKPLSKEEFEQALRDLSSLVLNTSSSEYTCAHCGEETDDEERADSCRCQSWHWREAFDKFGFDDGENLFNGTDEVAGEIERLGYDVSCDFWGNHNYLITSICPKGSEENLLENTDDFQRGYTDPRKALPEFVIRHLDEVYKEES